MLLSISGRVNSARKHIISGILFIETLQDLGSLRVLVLEVQSDVTGRVRHVGADGIITDLASELWFVSINYISCVHGPQ